ncbi:glucosamine-6-phosphate deaminase [Desulfosporosinus lacus]|uniref:Glucosamine-6-phosphate deaminase n=1 Tax=Desulfosporosinus lacus DSM 15449 TaxID=1121420 RepID=A0A1M6F8S1_9FIRM|nr:glucosamine-6-phosphate deaminase [Desulfosporosinus lacus]SHI94051.1 glucosamine-6-phosphate deaminase [Desulfosporosinus lacus DSM 15449]
MEIIYAQDNLNLGQMAARWVAREILVCPNLVLGLPTGSTPIGMYHYLTRLVQEGIISFAQARTFNLDEYVGLTADHPQSYAFFMREHFWSKVDLPNVNVNIPRGDVSNLAVECLRYDDAIQKVGGIDVQILGLGPNGHIGFNEPSHNMEVHTHVVDLTAATIQANTRFFPDSDAVPRQAVTMGVGNIMQARKILLLVSGESKRDILAKTINGPVSTEVPSSILQLHADLTVLTDIKLRVH